jgi:hypothetical protein
VTRVARGRQGDRLRVLELLALDQGAHEALLGGSRRSATGSA